MKLIAFYLPQFYPTEFNNEHWGEGFTEWSNVARAAPQFAGHHQPRLPAGLGFYDLRVKETRRRQAQMAKEYGIYGFCYYYYRFDGRRQLDYVLERAKEESEIPFCICWANENWTRSWDGLGQNILIEQKHSDFDDMDFIREGGPMLASEKYIKIDGKPLLLIYRTELWKDIKATAAMWREYMRANHGTEIYLVRCNGFEKDIDPASIGFDAAYQFPPLNFSNSREAMGKVKLNKDFEGGIPDYGDWRGFVKEHPAYKLFRGIIPGWDNTPRKMARAHIFYGSSPEKYKQWLLSAISYTEQNFEPSEQVIFINAWNEWAEGAILEPCNQYGYEYLNATRSAMA